MRQEGIQSLSYWQICSTVPETLTSHSDWSSRIKLQDSNFIAGNAVQHHGIFSHHTYLMQCNREKRYLVVTAFWGVLLAWNIMKYGGSWTWHRKSIIWDRAGTARALLNNLISFSDWWAFHYIPALKDKILLFKIEVVITYAMHNRNFRTCAHIAMNKKKNISWDFPWLYFTPKIALKISSAHNNSWIK